MIRLVASVSLRTLLRARANLQAGDPDTPSILRVLKNGEITFTYRTPPVLDAQGNVVTPAGSPVVTFDILVDRDSNDFPPAVVTFLGNRAEVLYVAEWLPDGTTNILKGADPGYHRFFGVPL